MSKEIIQWASIYLSSHGYALQTTPPENIKNTPWSQVLRFSTSQGDIYLKHTPELLGLEAQITQILHDQFQASVPEMIAHNAELHCFLMKDAGRPLREVLKKQFDVGLLGKAIDQFTSLQLAVSDHIDLFLSISVPDWRLDQLPELYQQLLSKKELLIADGLSEQEINELNTLTPKVINLCQKLSQHSIKESLVQPDFHDNNVLIDETSQDLTLIDLGEIVISHPFFSLVTCLQQAKKHHGLTEEDDAYRQLTNACLKKYEVYGSQKDLLEAFATAQVLQPVYGALATERLMMACGKEKLNAFQSGRLSTSLKDLLTILI